MLFRSKRKSDFGKIVKKAFPFVSSRRLGSAGKQVAHYSGIAPCNGLSRGRGGVVAEAKRSPPKLPRKSALPRRQSNSSPRDPAYEVYDTPPRSLNLNRKRKVIPYQDDMEESEETYDDSDYVEEEGHVNRRRNAVDKTKTPPSKRARRVKREEHDEEEEQEEEEEEEEEEEQRNNSRRRTRSAYNVPPSPGPTNIYINNTIKLDPNASRPQPPNHQYINQDNNPHLGTDAFFAASSPYITTRRQNGVDPQHPHPHPQQQNRIDPHGEAEDYSTGNDQSPPPRTKPIRRPQVDGLLSLTPEFLRPGGPMMSPHEAKGKFLSHPHPQLLLPWK